MLAQADQDNIVALVIFLWKDDSALLPKIAQVIFSAQGRVRGI